MQILLYGFCCLDYIMQIQLCNYAFYCKNFIRHFIVRISLYGLVNLMDKCPLYNFFVLLYKFYPIFYDMDFFMQILLCCFDYVIVQLCILLRRLYHVIHYVNLIMWIRCSKVHYILIMKIIIQVIVCSIICFIVCSIMYMFYYKNFFAEIFLQIFLYATFSIL